MLKGSVNSQIYCQSPQHKRCCCVTANAVQNPLLMADPIRQIYSSKWCPIPHNKCYSGTCVVLITLNCTHACTSATIMHSDDTLLPRIAVMVGNDNLFMQLQWQWQSLYAMTGLCFNSSEISLLCASSPLSLQLYLQIKTRHAALNWQVKKRGEKG